MGHLARCRLYQPTYIYKEQQSFMVLTNEIKLLASVVKIHRALRLAYSPGHILPFGWLAKRGQTGPYNKPLINSV